MDTSLCGTQKIHTFVCKPPRKVHFDQKKWDEIIIIINRSFVRMGEGGVKPIQAVLISGSLLINAVYIQTDIVPGRTLSFALKA